MQNTVGAAAAERRHRQGRAVSHRRRVSCSTPCARTRVLADQRRRIRAERNGVDAVAADAGRPAGRRLPLRRRRRRSGQRRHRDAPASSAPRAGVVLGPWQGTELYANAGFGFHSNDARGATITRDPTTGEPADAGHAAGAREGRRGRRADGRGAAPADHASPCGRCRWTRSCCSSATPGSTEAGRPSHRWGVELANYYAPRPWLTLDADVSWSRAHFTDDDPAGDRIPGAVQTVVSGGVDRRQRCTTSSAACGCATSGRGR